MYIVITLHTDTKAAAAVAAMYIFAFLLYFVQKIHIDRFTLNLATNQKNTGAHTSMNAHVCVPYKFRTA